MSSPSLFFLVRQGPLPKNRIRTDLLEQHHWAGNDHLSVHRFAVGAERAPATLSHILQLAAAAFTAGQPAEVTSSHVLLQEGTEHVG